MSNELAVERSKFRRRLKKMLLDDQEVINLADTMREEEEGFGLSDALVRIVSMAYQKGVFTAIQDYVDQSMWMDLYGDMFDEEEDQNA
jgi:hypothetical protein